MKFRKSHKALSAFNHNLIDSLVLESTGHDFFEYLVAILSEIQILGFSIYFSFYYDSSPTDSHIDFFKDICSFLSYNTFFHAHNGFHFELGPAITMITLFYCLIILLYILLSLQHFQNKNKGFPLLKLVFKRIAFINQHLLNPPILGCTFRMMIDYINGNLLYFGNYQSIAGLLHAILILIVHLYFMKLCINFNFHPFHTGNFLGTLNGNHLYVNFVQRLGNMLIYSFEVSSLSRWIFIFFNSAILGLKLNDLMLYYNHQPNQMRLFSLSVELSACIFNTLSSLLPSEYLSSILYSIILISILAYILLRHHLEDELYGNPHKYIARPPKLRKDNWFKKYVGLFHILKIGFSFTQEQNHLKSREEIEYIGFMMVHSGSCNDDGCVCKFFSKNLEKKLSLNSKDFSFAVSNFNYKIRMEFFGAYFNTHSVKNCMRLLCCQQILETMPSQYLSALSVISEVKKVEASYLEQYFFSKLFDRIIALADSESITERVDINAFMKHQMTVEKLNGLILNNCKTNLEFWKHYKQNNIKISTLTKLSKESDQLGEKILEEWNNLNQISSYLAIDQYLTMALYYSIIRNSENKGDHLLKGRDKILIKYYSEFEKVPFITDKTLLDPNNMQVRLSMSKESLGTMIFISENVKNFYGLRAKDLIGRNLNLIVPRFIRDSHQQFLEDHLEKGRTSRLNKNIILFGENTQGYVVPQRIYISPYPDEKYGFSYLGIIRPILDIKDAMILIENGVIGGLTKSLAKYLKVDVKNIENLSFFDFCPGFENINRMFNMHYFLAFHKIDSPIWLREGNEADSQTSASTSNLKMNSTLPSPFNLSPERAKNMIIPISEIDYMNVQKKVRVISTKGFETVVYNKNRSDSSRFNIKILIEVLKDGTVIKYLTFQQLAKDVKVTMLDSENNVEEPIETFSEDEAASEKGKSDIQDNTTALKYNDKFSRGLTIKTTKNINHQGPNKNRFELNGFISPKSVKSDSPNDNPREFKPIVSGFSPNRREKGKNLSSDGTSTDRMQKEAKYDYLGEDSDHNTLIKELKMKNLMSGELQHKETSISSKKSKFSISNKNFEKMLEVDIQTTGRKIVNMSFLGLMLLNIIFVIFSHTTSIEKLSVVKKTFSLRSQTSIRNFEVLKQNLNLQLLLLASQNYLPYNYTRSKNFFENLLEELKESNSLLRQNNFELRLASDETVFFSKVDFYENLNSQIESVYTDGLAIDISMNVYELTNLLVSSTDRFLSKNLSSLEFDADFEFLMNNYKGDFMNKLDSNLDFVNKNLYESSNSLLTFINAVLITIAILTIIYFSIFVYEEVTTKKKKRAFTNALVYINEKEVEKVETSITEYYKLFEKTPGFDTKYLQRSKSEDERKQKNKNSKLIKSIDLEKVDKSIIKRVVVTFLISLFLPLIYYFYILSYSNIDSDLKSSSNELLSIEDQILQFLLLIGATYQYSSNPDSKLKLSSVEDIIKNKLSYLKNTQGTVFSSFELNSSSFTDIIFQDLCYSLATNSSNCYTSDQGSATKGLIYLNSYLLSGVQEVMRSFGDSDMSKESVINILKSQDLENGYLQMKEIYRNLLKRLNENFIENEIGMIDSHDESNLNMTIAFIILILSLGVVSKKVVMNSAMKEMRENRKILKMVPVKLIMSTKILHNYLFKSSLSIFREHVFNTSI